MEPDLGLALQITAIGMGLVFGAILVLWAVMALLVRVTSGSEPEVAPSGAGATVDAGASPVAAPPPGARRVQLARLAAAAAVGVVLAQRQAAVVRPEGPPTATVSAWQAAMRAAQLKQRGPTR
jgi:hypothetical protein